MGYHRARWLDGWTTAEQLDGLLKDRQVNGWTMRRLDGILSSWTSRQLDNAMARRAIIELDGLTAQRLDDG